MTQADADRFAEEWVSAWNAHDLDAILAHYAEDVVFTSPFVVRLTGDPSGTLHGTAALRDYFGRALDRFPDLRFRLCRALAGVTGVVLVYDSVEGLAAAEVFEVGSDGRTVRVTCHYAPPSTGG